MSTVTTPDVPAVPDPHGEQLHVSDPARIRALAHPVRLDLLQLLDERGEATATQCAEQLGETVANCSFHLRTLARAGFIEPAPARGREKPWRPTSRGRMLEPDGRDPASLRAVAELAGIAMLREVERVRGFLQRSTEVPAEWVNTVAVTTSAFYATAEEMREVVAAIAAVTERFDERLRDPSLRPAGARIGRLFATVNPDDFPTPEVD
ncbi:helix-turn-helix domain-containing protein [Actinotalea sp.]|uniref:ArsR/SmtB family transcription factor n=1 Tax=Actinotalea sp. TaxID=1872145 RepID=UPI002C5276FD|nr:helix-turn-helix domain-containing protein [Actinotalea sp.]HQY32930.1 helix-turn-helix domain-containing protein [Actinotalea sp.]HRA51447.1 helix-turn-helix domain-containing protein [Actinotalea sp.]